MKSLPSIPIYTPSDVELNLGTVEFAIARIETLSIERPATGYVISC
jgi:hypothetical protein